MNLPEKERMITSLTELKEKILEVCPDAQFELQDSEIIIKTRLKIGRAHV